jgi:hypothetical protein
VNKTQYAILLVALIAAAPTFPFVAAETVLVLEAEQHWETYGEGGTCIPGQHNLAIADIDADGRQEMVTGGYAYDVLENGTRTFGKAPLKIWSWNGQNITLEHSEYWRGNIGIVSAGDADSDGKIEIVTAGGKQNSTGSVSGTISFWNWDTQTLILRGSYQGITVSALSIADVNGDQHPEILTVGKTFGTPAQLSIMQWNGTELTLKARIECSDSTNGTANSVYSGDLNSDGTLEIVTAGYANSLTDSKGQLRVWTMNGSTLTKQCSAEWSMVGGYALNSAGNIQGNTMVNSVKVGDVDGDETFEVVTGGFTYNGTKVDGQLRIWNFTGQALHQELSYEWATQDITELKTVALGDVDDDGKPEIVASGGTVGYASFAANSTEKETAQLRIWSWDGKSLTLKQSQDWVIGEGVMAWNVASADLNSDQNNEIVTVGCMYVGNLCDPDLRIWSIDTSTEPSGTSYLLVAIAALVIFSVAVAILITDKKGDKQRDKFQPSNLIGKTATQSTELCQPCRPQAAP